MPRSNSAVISSPPPERDTSRPAAATDPERQALTRQRILEAALELLDAEGLEALSMRRLGAVLGVEAMSLYHHFSSKGALLDGIVALLLRQVPLPEIDSAPWDLAILQGFVDFRRVMLAHPSAVPLVCERPALDPESLVPMALAFAALSAAGFSPDDVYSAWCTLLSYVLGYIESEVSGVGKAARGAEMLELIQRLEGPAYEALRAAWSESGLRTWSDDREYVRGLEVILAGLRLRLAESARPGT